MTIFGDHGHPSVLTCGIESNSKLAHSVRDIASVVRPLEGIDPSVEVRQADYDAIIAIGNVKNVSEHLYILQFGGHPGADIITYSDEEGGIAYQIHTDKGLAAKLEVPDGLPEGVDKLSRESLAPHLLDVSPRRLLWVSAQRRAGIYTSEPDPELRVIEPFVLESDEAPCAGRWSRRLDDGAAGPEHWWLPKDCPHPEMWATAAFTVWHSIDSVRFPAKLRWQSDPRWMTKAELDAALALTAAQEELSRAVGMLQAEVNLSEARFEERRIAADQNERRLLTTQGDGLKNEVSSALFELGFLVIDSDEERKAEGSRLLEDLEVRDGDDWTALAEVRGYGRGAKTSDLQRLARAARGFEKRTGREPDARWYVVNHNLSQPPAERRPVLAGAESDVDEFALDGGCVIDTRDLFLLRESVRTARLTAQQARDRLKGCHGVYVHDESA